MKFMMCVGRRVAFVCCMMMDDGETPVSDLHKRNNDIIETRVFQTICVIVEILYAVFTLYSTIYCIVHILCERQI